MSIGGEESCTMGADLRGKLFKKCGLWGATVDTAMPRAPCASASAMSAVDVDLIVVARAHR